MDEKDIAFASEQMLAIATLIGAVAALPVLIEFLFERSKRRERIALSLETTDVAAMPPAALAGCDALLAGIADLIDRARHPEAYQGLRVGNEILIVGPSLMGKKTLARRIAIEAQMDRLITVHNPRNADALAKAKNLVQKSGDDKLMLLLPRLDLIEPQEDEELLTQLDALIETATSRANILVVGTTIRYVAGNEIDNLFGIVLAMPGTTVATPPVLQRRPEVTAMLDAVVRHYLAAALSDGDVLAGLTEDAFVQRVLAAATNPAQVEDIVALCQTVARYRERTKQNPGRAITPDILETVMRRVILAENRNLGDGARD